MQVSNCLVNTIKDCGTNMTQQIAALLRPKPRDSEITTTSNKTKIGYIRLVDFQNIGKVDVVVRPNGITRDSVKVKVSVT